MTLLSGTGSSAATTGATGGGVPTLTEREFEAAVLRSELPVLIEFTADWCAPCKKIAPEVEAFAEEMRGKCSVVKVDIDKAPALARELRVKSVPTFMVFAEQRIADVAVGAIGKKKMREMMEPYLPRAESWRFGGETSSWRTKTRVSARGISAGNGTIKGLFAPILEGLGWLDS
jgi:thioredoxin